MVIFLNDFAADSSFGCRNKCCVITSVKNTCPYSCYIRGKLLLFSKVNFSTVALDSSISASEPYNNLYSLSVQSSVLETSI